MYNKMLKNWAKSRIICAFTDDLITTTHFHIICAAFIHELPFTLNFKPFQL